MRPASGGRAASSITFLRSQLPVGRRSTRAGPRPRRSSPSDAHRRHSSRFESVAPASLPAPPAVPRRYPRRCLSSVRVTPSWSRFSLDPVVLMAQCRVVAQVISEDHKKVTPSLPRLSRARGEDRVVIGRTRNRCSVASFGARRSFAVDDGGPSTWSSSVLRVGRGPAVHPRFTRRYVSDSSESQSICRSLVSGRPPRLAHPALHDCGSRSIRIVRRSVPAIQMNKLFTGFSRNKRLRGLSSASTYAVPIRQRP